MIKINGELYDLKGARLSAWLQEAGFDCLRIAVERNGEILSRAQYEDTILEDGDVLEVVRFVGGG